MKEILFTLFLGGIFITSLAQDKSVNKDGDLVITKGQVRVNGQTINYTATAGYMLMKDEKDSVKAKLFFIAYTKDGEADPSKRPILFAYNGGPGSASLWLHMGALGPKRILMTDFGGSLPPPYKYIDNEYTWLDKTDLVFIDPMMTGYTRPAGKNDKSEFTGFENDIHFVGDFIRLYTTKYQRWSSPKLVGGESYGTTRSAGLAGYLQDRYGFYLNGVILISAVLDFSTLDDSPGNDRSFPLLLPTLSATAWYHKKLDPRFNDLSSLLKEVEEFAMNDYAPALGKGDQLSSSERDAIIDKLHTYTGLSKEYIDQNNLRFYVGRVNKELLRKEGKTVGRYDTRVTGYDRDNAGEQFDYDPSFENTVYGPYAAAINDYIRRTLKYENDIPYEILSGRVYPWPFSTNKYLNVAETLRSAMTKNPFLKVWIANGYFDMATPYFQTRDVVNHMGLRKELKSNITLTYYPSGHMIYTNLPSLQQMKKDFIKFMDNALPQ